MAKKRDMSDSSVVDPLIQEAETQAPVGTVEPELAPATPEIYVQQEIMPVGTVSSPEPILVYDETISHLQIIDEYRSITVPTFRELALCGNEAVQVLASYVDDGLVERSWQAGYGRYSLTDSGRELLKTRQ